MKPLLQKLFLLFLTLCFLCSCESDSLASRPWIKGYSPRPDNYNPADYTNTFIGSSPPSALRVTVSATAITKAAPSFWTAIFPNLRFPISARTIRKLSYV